MSMVIAIIGGLVVAAILFGFIRGLVRLPENRHRANRSDGL